MPTDSSRNGSADTRQTFLYFGWLTLFLYLATPAGYLVDIQTSYMLKNQLHATATQISIFRLLTGIPVYFAFAFGLVRDQWNPFGLRDRGFFLIFAPATAAAFIWMATSRLSYRGLLIGMLLAMLASRFHRGRLSGVDGPGGAGTADVRAAERAVECCQLRPGACGSVRLRIHLRTSAAERNFLSGGGTHLL